MTRFLLGGSALAALLAIAPATAQMAQAPVAQRAPASPVQSRAHVGLRVQTMFQRLDANRDGFIARDEAQAARLKGGKREAWQQRRGADRSPEQRAAAQAKRFDRIDANRDGVLTRDEFARAAPGWEQRLASGRGQSLTGGKGMAGLRGRMFDMADANRDTRVSMPEAMAAAFRRFDAADANRDGQLTREERIQARRQMRGQRRSG